MRVSARRPASGADTSAEALAHRHAKENGFPSAKLTVVGVTGTNGKTSTTFLLDAIFRAAGHTTGLIGTVECRVGDRAVPASFTTPPSDRYQALLALMARVGVSHVATEISSHGLAEHRVDGTDFDAAVFTNLTRDHLDFHGTMEAYAAAKRRLFEVLLPGSRKRKRTAIVNVDDALGRILVASVPRRVETCTFSVRPSALADVTPRRVVQERGGLRGSLRTPRGTIELSSPLIGKHNLSNILGAVAAAQALGLPNEAIMRALETAQGAPGRLERVPNGREIDAIVDYAHTPDALARVLGTCRQLARPRRGRVIVVFGCGGDRDRVKRPMMGRVAAKLADDLYVTSDNPRGEDAAAILRDIGRGIGARGRVIVEADRASAIRRAVRAARRDDVLLVAGKGHESYQTTGTESRFFDDRQELALALAGRADPIRIAPIPSFVATLRQVQRAVGARLRGGELARTSISGITFFPEETQRASLFILHPALRLEGTPDLLERVALAGAAGAIVSRAFVAFMAHARAALPKLPILVVDEVQVALQQLAGWHRRRFRIPVIAITGSAGKSSTTQLTAALLGGRMNVLCTQGNLNGQLGVPLTLLRLTAQHEAAVIEAGISMPGEMSILADMIAPTVGVIVNASTAHTEFLGVAVAREKAMLWRAAKRSSVLVFEASDPVLRDLAAAHRARRLTFGSDSTADVRAEKIRANERESRFDLVIDGARARVRLRRPGRHQIDNALATACVGWGLGMPLAEIASGLSVKLPVLPGRGDVLRLAGDVTVIDDTHNSNLKSALAAVDRLLLHARPDRGSGRLVVVLADMLELGAQSGAAHRRVGEEVARAKVDLLFTVGRESKATASAAIGAGMPRRAVRPFLDRASATEALLAQVEPNDTILLKGSAGMRLEETVRSLLRRLPTSRDGSGTRRTR